MDAPGLYVHIPFCSRVCPYCDFAVQTGGPQRRAGFLDALVREIECSSWEGLAFDTVYLGGGTPSALRPDQLQRILDALEARFELSEAPWITLEANPEDVTPEAVQSWLQVGVGTVSLGVQAFADDELHFLGRRHDGQASTAAVRTCLESSLPIVSVDLIFGLPGQSNERWRRTLEQTIELAPQHVSCYQLTIHQGTRFGRLQERGQLEEMPDDEQAELFVMTHELLGHAGYVGYEVSNFARAGGFESRHNRKYWRHAAYLGIGPSAHSFDGQHRWWNRRRLVDWQEAVLETGTGVEAGEHLGPRELALEALIFGLRTRAGVDFERLRARLGIDLHTANDHLIATLVDERLVTLEGSHLRPTLRGMVVAEWLVTRFEIPAT